MVQNDTSELASYAEKAWQTAFPAVSIVHATCLGALISRVSFPLNGWAIFAYIFSLIYASFFVLCASLLFSFIKNVGMNKKSLGFAYVTICLSIFPFMASELMIENKNDPTFWVYILFTFLSWSLCLVTASLVCHYFRKGFGS